MQRFTRAESQRRTRDRILMAAAELFLEKGFRATSIGSVADAAGYSHGAVYSNFAGKTDLGVAVVDLLYERESAALEQMINQSDGSIESSMAGFAAWGAAAIGDVRWARLELEVMATASEDEGGVVEAASSRRYARIRAAGAAGLSEMAKRAGVQLGVDPDELMVGALALALGLGLQRVADPTIPGEHIATFVAALMTGMSTGSA